MPYLGLNPASGLSGVRFRADNWAIIGKNNNTRTVQAESSKFASVSFDHGFQIWVGWNWLERHLTVFCIDRIVSGFVVYYVNCSTYVKEKLSSKSHLFCHVIAINKDLYGDKQKKPRSILNSGLMQKWLINLTFL